MTAPASRSSRRGGALILALLFMGVMTIGFATWITLIRQRARVADLDVHQARKRLAAANAEVLARDYLLRRALASNADDDGYTTVSDAGSWSINTATTWNGSSQSHTPAWTGYALDSSIRPAGLNGFSPSYDYPYSKSFTFTSSYKRLFFVDTDTSPEKYANDTTTIRGYVRSRNLLLGGDLLVLHRPTVSGGVLPAVTGNIAVQGRVVHFAPDIAASSYTARSQRFTAPAPITGGIPASSNVVPADLAGAALLWSNLAWTPLSSGNVSGNNLESTASGDDWRIPDFTGQLNFIDNPSNNASNSLRAELIAGNTTLQPAGTTAYNDSRGLVLDGSGLATFSPCLGSITSDLPSAVLSNANGLTEIVIDGQTGSTFSSYAQYRPSLALVYTQSGSGTNLTTIRLRHQNRRRMILALKKDYRTTAMAPVNVIVETAGPDAEWHLLILTENVPLTFSYSATAPYATSTVRLYGGIETNSPLSFPAAPGLCEINLQSDTHGLIRMSPRLAWVETYLTGKL